MGIGTEQIIHMLCLLVVFVPAITVHEYAHAVTAFRFGDDTAKRLGRMTLNPAVHLDPLGTIGLLIGFGWGRPVPVNRNRLNHPRASFWVALAGPISNVILALFSTVAFRVLIRFLPEISPAIYEPALMILQFSIQINLVLIFFNLLPIFPLDGSHMVENLLPLELARPFREFGEAYGAMILFGLLLIGAATPIHPIRMIIGPVVNFFFQLCIGY